VTRHAAVSPVACFGPQHGLASLQQSKPSTQHLGTAAQQPLFSAQHFSPFSQQPGFAFASQQADFGAQQAILAVQQSPGFSSPTTSPANSSPEASNEPAINLVNMRLCPFEMNLKIQVEARMGSPRTRNDRTQKHNETMQTRRPIYRRHTQ
jgi:hypothetical protein